MAAVFRVVLWGLVLIAPGGILLAPLLAAHELRRRSVKRAQSVAGVGSVELLDTNERLSVAAVSVR
jgi:hypothetical protein